MLKRHVRKKDKKRKMHTQRRYATCPQGMSKKKKKEKDSPHPWKIKEERWIMQRSSSILHTKKKNKYSHTLAHLDQII